MWYVLQENGHENGTTNGTVENGTSENGHENGHETSGTESLNGDTEHTKEVSFP